MSKDINKTDEQGRKQGRWVEEDEDGNVLEGSYADGKEAGHWVFRLADGRVQEVPYVDGERHGHWVTGDKAMSENERRYKFTVTLPPRKPRKPLRPETKRVLNEIPILGGLCGGGLFVYFVAAPVVVPVIREVTKWLFS